MLLVSSARQDAHPVPSRTLQHRSLQPRIVRGCAIVPAIATPRSEAREPVRITLCASARME
ncbi:hypothetical protein E4T43_05556 [Aureobasidium subglaciale]|nr:hypothetical protein E4T43_05556 [Aureobasidium subglaciale]